MSQTNECRVKTANNTNSPLKAKGEVIRTKQREKNESCLTFFITLPVIVDNCGLWLAGQVFHGKAVNQQTDDSRSSKTMSAIHGH